MISKNPPVLSCKLAVRALPLAPRNAVVGWMGAALKVKVKAPALAGRANEELCEFVADEIGLPRRAVRICSGAKSRQKLLTIDGLSLAATIERLSRRLNAR